MVLMAVSISTESTASVCHDLFIGMRKIPALDSSKQPLVRIEELMTLYMIFWNVLGTLQNIMMLVSARNVAG